MPIVRQLRPYVKADRDEKPQTRALVSIPANDVQPGRGPTTKQNQAGHEMFEKKLYSHDRRCSFRKGVPMKKRGIFSADRFLEILGIFVMTTGFLWPAPDLVPHRKPKADLYVSAVTITPNPPRARKDMITIKVTVRNKGNKANSNLKFPCSLNMLVKSVDRDGFQVAGDFHNAIPMFAYNIPTLEPGQSIQISKTVTLRYSGPHRVSGVINTEGLEPDEEIGANNSYQADFNALPPPAPADLVLESALLTPDGRLRLGLSNRGEEIPDVDFEFSYIRIKSNGENDRILFLKEVDPRGFLKKGRGGIWTPGSPDRLYYTWPNAGYQGILLQPGQSKTLQVIVDYSARILDSNRNNNSKTVTLSRPN